MAYGVKINGLAYIGHSYKGIEFLDVWKGAGGEWRAEVKCTCGKINRMTLRKAMGLCACTHKKKRVKKYD